MSKDLASSGLFSLAHDESYALKADAVLSDKFPRAHEMLLLAGRLCGKALLEGHHLEHLRLNPILLKHVVAEPLSLKDLALLDEDLAKGLGGPRAGLRRRARGGARGVFNGLVYLPPPPCTLVPLVDF